MSKSNGAMAPAGVLELRQELDQWREGRRRGERIPAELWSRAAELAVAHGVGAVSRLLGLEYYKLKRLMETEAEEPDGGVKFIDVRLPPVTAPVPSVTIEWARPDGSRLTVRGIDLGTIRWFVDAFAGSGRA